MRIKKYQQDVDNWIKTHGVRYFDIKTNTLLLAEEVGELAKVIARQYGEQSFKVSTDFKTDKSMIKDEMGDIFFVLTCMAINWILTLILYCYKTSPKKRNGTNFVINRIRNCTMTKFNYIYMWIKEPGLKSPLYDLRF